MSNATVSFNLEILEPLYRRFLKIVHADKELNLHQSMGVALAISLDMLESKELCARMQAAIAANPRVDRKKLVRDSMAIVLEMLEGDGRAAA